MIWSDWLTVAGTGMGVTATQAGFILSFTITALLDIIALIATRGKQANAVVSFLTLICLVCFTFMGWLPVATGSILAITVTFIIAKYFRDWF